MTGAGFRKRALAMDGAVEAPHFSRRSFRVKKKIFATLTEDEREAMVRVYPIRHAYDLIRAQPEVFFSYGGFTERSGCLGVRLPLVDTAQLETLLGASYAHVAAPKKKVRR